MRRNKLLRETRGWHRLLTLVVVMGMLLSSCKAEKTRVYRVGVLAGLRRFASIMDGFKEGMAELGYVEGKNIVYDVQETEFDIAIYQNIVKKFIADKVDLILVFPTDATIEVKKATEGTDIPVIFTYASIEGTGLVNSLREPGGNMTGVRYPVPDIAVKRFEIMRAIAPNATRIWIPYQRDYPIVESQLEILRPLAAAEGVTLIEFPAASPAELEAELSARAQQADLGIDAIMFVSEPLSVTPEFFVVMGRFAREHKLPIGGTYMTVEGYNSLFGVALNPFDSGKLAAPLADKVLKGTPAGTIPVVSQEPYIKIDYKEAQMLGLTVPESLLIQANEIVR
ncbi:MAG TPA: ABC transporter substrate-binding protein [Anaerolineae bacterium]|nr:ABC transporter substrate-binding protein [Anaerolineae bacterium]